MSSQSLSMDIDNWDPEAFLIVMSIIHGRTKMVPREVDLELLAKIAVIVDYYGCHDVMEIVKESWFKQINDIAEEGSPRDLVLGLFASWVFSKPELFHGITEFAVLRFTEPMRTLGLPIPSTLVGEYVVGFHIATLLTD